MRFNKNAYERHSRKGGKYDGGNAYQVIKDLMLSISSVERSLELYGEEDPEKALDYIRSAVEGAKELHPELGFPEQHRPIPEGLNINWNVKPYTVSFPEEITKEQLLS